MACTLCSFAGPHRASGTAFALILTVGIAIVATGADAARPASDTDPTLHAPSVVLDPDGFELCTAAGDQTNPRAISAAGASAIVVWRDTRRGASLFDIYAIGVTPEGTIAPGWPANGLALSANGTAGPPIPVPDGAGGALVLWKDSRDGGQVYAQRVSASGAIASGWPADGRAVTALAEPKVDLLLDAIGDGEGGAYLAWKQIATCGPNCFATGPCIRSYVMRIDGEAAVATGWTSPGLGYGHCPYQSFTNIVTWGKLRENPGGGVFFVHNWGVNLDFAFYGFWAYVERIATNGVNVSSHVIEDQGPYSTANTGVMDADAVTDEAGGFIVTWVDTNVSPDEEFTRRTSFNSSPPWPDPTNPPAYQYLEPDGAGGAYYIGSQAQVVGLDVARRAGDGSIPPGWTSSGRIIARPTTMGTVARSWFNGDLLLAWADNRGASGFDIRAITITPDGGVGFGFDPAGNPLCEATGSQTLPVVAPMAAGRSLVCWQDQRSGAWDIRAGRLGTYVNDVPPLAGRNGTLIESMLPNPARGRVQLTLRTPGDQVASLRVLDLAGRPVGPGREVHSSGASQQIELDLGGLPIGVYWLQVSQGLRSESRRLAIVR